jgi:thioesterase domain-containing protein
MQTETTLVLADDPSLDTAADQSAKQKTIEGWRRYAPNLAVWHGPGNHLTILKAPYVQDLAQWWRATCDRSREEDALSDSV